MAQVPPDTKEKEKVIGGLLTLAQGAWIACGFMIGAVVAIVLNIILPTFISLMIGFAIFLGFSYLFVMYKVHDLPFFRYLCLKRRFKNKKKVLPNRRTRRHEIDIF